MIWKLSQASFLQQVFVFLVLADSSFLSQEEGYCSTGRVLCVCLCELWTLIIWLKLIRSNLWHIEAALFGPVKVFRLLAMLHVNTNRVKQESVRHLLGTSWPYRCLTASGSSFTTCVRLCKLWTLIILDESHGLGSGIFIEIWFACRASLQPPARKSARHSNRPLRSKRLIIVITAPLIYSCSVSQETHGKWVRRPPHFIIHREINTNPSLTQKTTLNWRYW